MHTTFEKETFSFAEIVSNRLANKHLSAMIDVNIRIRTFVRLQGDVCLSPNAVFEFGYTPELYLHENNAV